MAERLNADSSLSGSSICVFFPYWAVTLRTLEGSASADDAQYAISLLR